MRNLIWPPVLAVAMFASACGGDAVEESTDQNASRSQSTSSSSTSTTSTPSPSVPSSSSSTTSTPVTSERPATNPTVDLPSIAPSDLPDLLAAWESATGEPLATARQLIGFPLDVAPPAGSTPASVDVRLRHDGEKARWEWTYEAFAAPGSVQEIDIELPEGGPGTIEGRLHYDPLFDSFGWSNGGQVISDPSSGAGGPQSVNWAYRPVDGELLIDDVSFTPVSARAWVDQDIDSGPDDRAGHRLDFTASTSSTEVPVPLMRGLLDELPEVEGRLTSARLASFERSSDSFDAAEGLRYLELSFTWILNGASVEEVGAEFIAQLPTSILQVGEESFFSEGFIEATDPFVGSSGEWTQAVVLLDRYPGNVRFSPADESSVLADSVQVEFDVRLEPNREVLSTL